MLAGSAKTVRIDGFDFGNSPREFLEPGRDRRADDDERDAALLAAASRCDLVLVGSLLNLDAVVREAAAAGSEDVAVLCAGVHGELAMDDAFVAGRMAAALGGGPTDSAAAAMRLARQLRDERGGPRRFAERTQPPRERPGRRHRLVRARERARRRAPLLPHGGEQPRR